MASLAAPVVLLFVGILLFGMLLVDGILVVPLIIPLAWFILELGDGVSAELLGPF